jgi:hypothetical protein
MKLVLVAEGNQTMNTRLEHVGERVYTQLKSNNMFFITAIVCERFLLSREKNTIQSNLESF